MPLDSAGWPPEPERDPLPHDTADLLAGLAFWACAFIVWPFLFAALCIGLWRVLCDFLGLVA